MEGLRLVSENLGVYLWYYAGSCARYFGVAGLLYCVFHIWFRRSWQGYRIQPELPARAEVSREIRWSLWSMAWTGLAGVLLYNLVRGGWTAVYFDIGEYGWGYFIFTVVLGVAGYDLWFYWQHRLLHTPWWFERAHAVHHRSNNPTAFANFAHHPIEIMLGNVYFVGMVVFVPQHPLATALVSMFIFGWGMIGHMGYEFYPRWFARTRAFGWFNTATHHNLHHSQVDCNYGMFFNFWDRVMGTNQPDYRRVFEDVARRDWSRSGSGGEEEVVAPAARAAARF